MTHRPNPVICELWRAGHIESRHRGAWALVDTDGRVIEGRGDHASPIFARSSTKSLQALPFVESGAADAIHARADELALAVSSHSGEPIHLAVARGILDRVGLDADALQCGPQKPLHPDHAHAPAQRISNMCSGKHSAFLATAVHMGDDPAHYLDPASALQKAVRSATSDMTDTDAHELGDAIDGCSAPTFRLSLRALATGVARVANPAGLPEGRAAACRRITEAVAAHPEMMGGTTGRIDTDLSAVTDGRIFAKSGAEGVFVIGVCHGSVGLAVKVDDGNARGYEHLVIELLAALGHLDSAELDRLRQWRDPARHNRDGIEVGQAVTPAAVLP